MVVREEVQVREAEVEIRAEVQVQEVEAENQEELRDLEAKPRERVLIFRMGTAAPTVPQEAAKQRRAPATMAREDIPAVGVESAETRKA